MKAALVLCCLWLGSCASVQTITLQCSKVQNVTIHGRICTAAAECWTAHTNYYRGVLVCTWN